MLYKLWICVLLLLSLRTTLFSQYSPDNNQEPPGIHWKTLDSEHFQIIFPEEISGDARRTANKLEYLYRPVGRSMPCNIKKIPLLLTTQSVIPNGYVTYAPRRSEWFGTPYMERTLNGEWYYLLASHEMRHIFQLDKTLNHGLNRVWMILSGEQFVSALNSLLVPRWFLEGDAVVSETALSHGGRGRQPSFTMALRCQAMQPRKFSYYKAFLGSYKNFIPDPYSLGYVLVSYGRKTFGAMSWANVLRRMSYFTFYPFAFSNSTRGITGKNPLQIYNQALTELEHEWKSRLKALVPSPAKIISPRDEDTYTNYLYPQFVGPDSIIVIKSGLDQIPQLTLLDRDGNEKRLGQIRPLYSISARGNMAAWSEYVPDIRWGKRNYADIYLLNMTDGKKTRLTHGQKYFSPALSPDGTRIAVVEYTPARRCRLKILNRADGQPVEAFALPENDLILSPEWSSDGSKIVFAYQNLQGTGLMIYEPTTGRVSTLIPPNWQGLANPVFFKNYVLFESFYSGIDNVYAVNIKTRRIYQVTSRPNGAFYPSAQARAGMLAFSDYQLNGHQLALMKLDTADWTPLEQTRVFTDTTIDSLVAQEDGQPVADPGNIPDRSYSVRDYSPWAGSIRFHSWYITPDTVEPGIRFISSDLLNTNALSLGLFYNRQENSPGISITNSYAAMYPIIDLMLERRTRSQDFRLTSGAKLRDMWTETNLGLALRLPFNFSRGIYNQSLSLSTSVRYSKIAGKDVLLRYDQNNGLFLPLSYSIQMQRLKLRAHRDFRPPWGQSLALLFRHTPFKGDYSGQQFYGLSRLYFPGLMAHHSLLLQAEYEEQRTGNYRFATIMQMARGYGYSWYDRLAAIRLNYALPLLYPDFALSAWLYIKRIRANVFFDYMKTSLAADREELRSAGLEILFDHHWFSLVPELTFGYRLAYRLNDGKPAHELFFDLPL